MAIRHKTPSSHTPVERTIGTLWTLKRADSTVRCLLLKLPDRLELRVMMDNSRLRTENRASHQEAFELAERWRARMIDRGWVPVRQLASA